MHWLISFERDFILSLSDNNKPNVIEAFNSTARYMYPDNIDNPFFEEMAS